MKTHDPVSNVFRLRAPPGHLYEQLDVYELAGIRQLDDAIAKGEVKPRQLFQP